MNARGAAQLPIAIGDYILDDRQDEELADLAYAAVAGSADQRPITVTLVRSRLRPVGRTPTILATRRTTTGNLVGAAALRQPARPTGAAPGRFWGPVVHPRHQRRGIGAALLDGLRPHLNGGPVTTAEIPAHRSAAIRFYTAAGWLPTGGATLYKADLPVADPPASPAGYRLRRPHPDEKLAPDITALYADANPDDPVSAASALDRWQADHRYQPSSLTLADRRGAIHGVALVYPLADSRHEEPTEALLADLFLHPDAATGLGTALAAHALNAIADETTATVARAIASPGTALAAALTDLTFRAIDDIRYFRPPTART